MASSASISMIRLSPLGPGFGLRFGFDSLRFRHHALLRLYSSC
jgi:hypothetical protein